MYIPTHMDLGSLSKTKKPSPTKKIQKEGEVGTGNAEMDHEMKVMMKKMKWNGRIEVYNIIIY